MKMKIFKSAAVFAVAAICACSSKPKTTAAIDTSSNVAQELAQTRRDIDYEKSNQLGLLSPDNFKKAEAKLEDAEEGLARNGNPQKVFDNLAQSRGWLDDSRQAGQRGRVLFAEPLDARANAVTVFDPDNRELIKADKDLKDLAENVEKNKNVNEKSIRKLTAQYNEVERARIKRTQINPIEARIKQGKSMEGKKLAPRTYAIAEADFEAIDRTIKINPFDRAQVAGRIQAANKSSSEFLSVISEIKGSNGRASESVVLNNRMRDKEMIEQQEAAAALAKQQQEESEQKLNQAHEEAERPLAIFKKLQQEIPAEEADIVMTSVGKIKVRVKDLQFKSNSADLSPAAAAKLTKVRSALNDINPKKILIEGHTDSIGSADKNKVLSETRAESVATVLTAGDNLKGADIETAGLGSDKPLKENKTKDGRKENRRVEITIETL